MEEQTNGVTDMNKTEVNMGVEATGVGSPAGNGLGEVNCGNIEGYTATSEDEKNTNWSSTNKEDTTNEGTSNWSKANVPTKVGFWGKLKSFLFTEIKVELTPKQQKIENDINKFLFKEITFGKKKNA